MHFLFSDETNTDPQNNPAVRFFVSGGLIVPSEAIAGLHISIEELRKKYGYKKGDTLKFNTVERPSHISPTQHAEIKREVVQAGIDSGCKFLVYVILHDIAERQGMDRIIEWGANHVFGKFNAYLSQASSVGVVISDRLREANQYGQFVEKFTVGLNIDGVTDSTPLDNIVLYSSSCNNASHLNSLADIVLGSFRYCINSPKNPDAASSMMKAVASMLWADKISEKDINPFEKGFTLRPKVIRFPPYQLEYQELIAHINALLDKD